MANQGLVSEREIALRVGGNFPTLKDYMDKRVSKLVSYSATRNFTLGGNSQLTLLPDTLFPGSILAVGIGSTQTGQTPTVLAGGGVPTLNAFTAGDESLTVVNPSTGKILNLVDIRFANSNEEVKVGDFRPAGIDPINFPDDERKVWGLIQTNGSDGGAIGTAGSENLRMVFVYVDGAKNLVPATLKADTYEFRYRKINQRRFEDANLSEEGGDDTERDVLDLAKALIPQITSIVRVTSAILADTVIDISASGGAYTMLGDFANAKLPGTLTDFQNNGKVTVKDCGVELPKIDTTTTDWAEWVSATSLKLKRDLDPGDIVIITVPKSY